MDEKFEKLKSEARALLKAEKFFGALKKYKQANSLIQTEKIENRIKKLKDFIVENELTESDEETTGNDKTTHDDENSPFKNIGDDYNLDRKLAEKLYPYQIDGILWMWKLHRLNKGGILGDDMGLGKTVQVIAYLSGLMESNQIKTALIVMPVSLIHNWQEEISKWSNGLRFASYHGSSVREKENKLYKIQRQGGVLLTSYGTMVTSSDKLSIFAGKKFTWDYFILDEGHKIKNPTKTNKAAHEINAYHRLVLTGTPIQNNLKELWALYDFCHQGTLLGSFGTFKKQYETPIMRSREKDATAGERRYGSMVAENLRTRIAPFFLRRTKAETIEHKENVNASQKSSQSLTRKNEFILWVFLTDVQIEIYESFLKSEDVKSILLTKRSPLVELNVLKKICDHPRLFSKKACAQLRLDGTMSEQNEVELLNDSSADLVSLNVDPELLLKESGKMRALITLLENLKDEGHRTLVFSMSRKILDIIHKILLTRNWKIMRLDGTVTKMEERQARINRFQNNTTYSVFLLTTQVGGVGLTITAADRVVIYDPSWNPATDAQAVDRAYRIGQKRDVVVYRFITCGTIEEKIYRRQIFKDSITRQATSKGDQNKDPHRYFTKNELRELFVLDDPTSSTTQMQLEKLHSHERKATPELNEHIKFLTSLEHIIFGLSDHDLMFKGNIEDDDVPYDTMPIENDYIERRVQIAQAQIIFESQRNEEYAKKAGTYVTTYFDDKNDRKFLFGQASEIKKSVNEEGYALDSYCLDDDEEDSYLKEVSYICEISPTSKMRESFRSIRISPTKRALEENSKSFFSKIRESNAEIDNKALNSGASSSKSFENESASFFSKIKESNLRIDGIKSENISPPNIARITNFFPPIKKTAISSPNTSILAPDSDDECVQKVEKNSVDCITIEDSEDEDNTTSKPTHSTPCREFLIEDSDNRSSDYEKEKPVKKLTANLLDSVGNNSNSLEKQEQRCLIKSSSKERLEDSFKLENSTEGGTKKPKYTDSLTMKSDSDNELVYISDEKGENSASETEKEFSDMDMEEKIFKAEEKQLTSLVSEFAYDNSSQCADDDILPKEAIKASVSAKSLEKSGFNESLINIIKRKSKCRIDSDSESEMNGDSKSFSSYGDKPMFDNSTASEKEIEMSIDLDEDSLPAIF